VAPHACGNFISNWRLETCDGNRFGDKLWASITVVERDNKVGGQMKMDKATKMPSEDAEVKAGKPKKTTDNCSKIAKGNGVTDSAAVGAAASEPGADGDVAAVAQDSGKAVSVSKLLSSMTGPMASTAGQLPPGFEMRSSEEIEREMFLEAQSKDAAEQQQQQQQQQQVATDARAPSLIPSAPSSATADGAPTAIAVPVDASPVLVATSPVASGVFVPVSCPYPRQLQILHAMGFSDPATCAAVLVLHRGDIQASVNELLSYAPEGHTH